MSINYLTPILEWSSLICPPVGLFLNFLFIWLVWRKTPKEMVVHSRILLQTCTLDIIILMAGTIGYPMYVGLEDGTAVVILHGFLIFLYKKLFGLFGFFFLYNILYFLYVMDTLSVGVQFVYRYLVFNRDVKITLPRYLQMLSVPVAAGLVLTTLAFFFRTPTVNNIQENAIQNILNEIGSDCGENCFTFIPERKTIFNIWTALIIICAFLCLTLIIVFAWLIIRFINKHSHLSQRMRRLNKELTINLIILVFYPILILLLEAFIDIEIYLIGGLTTMQQSARVQLHQSFSLLASWIPLFNPCASILTNTPYRVAIVRLLWRKTNSSNQVQPIG